MKFKQLYENRKEKLLNDKTIIPDNRKLWGEFFKYEEKKLKQINDLKHLDESCYKTLGEYCIRLNTANKWFKNKSWYKLTKEDIKKVYEDLEEGDIKNNRGERYSERRTYYNKIFKSKPFQLAGKDGLAREIIQHYKPKKNHVRFIDEQDFIKLPLIAIKPQHKLLIWLSWDIGENVFTLLQLKKKDFTRQTSPETKEPEYLVNLHDDIIKRARTERSEITNYKETVQLLDTILLGLKDDDKVFNFEYRMAKKLLDRAVRITRIKCKPKGEKPTFKDLRSGMACNLLKKGWTTDEVNARLGHKPSSRELDKYVNFLALDRHKPKQKLYDNHLQQVLKEMEDLKFQLKLINTRMEQQKQDYQQQIRGVFELIKKKR